MKSLRHAVSFHTFSDFWYDIGRYLMIRYLHNIFRISNTIYHLDKLWIHSNLYAYIHHSYWKMEMRYWFWMDRTSLSFRSIRGLLGMNRWIEKSSDGNEISQKISYYIPLHITEENRNCRLTRQRHQHICVNRWGSNLLKLTHTSN